MLLNARTQSEQTSANNILSYNRVQQLLGTLKKNKIKISIILRCNLIHNSSYWVNVFLPVKYHSTSVLRIPPPCLLISAIYSSSFILSMEAWASVGLLKMCVFSFVRYHQLRRRHYAMSESQASQLLVHWVVLPVLFVHFSGEVVVKLHLLVLVEDVFLRNSCLYHIHFLFVVEELHNQSSQWRIVVSPQPDSIRSLYHDGMPQGGISGLSGIQAS